MKGKMVGCELYIVVVGWTAIADGESVGSLGLPIGPKERTCFYELVLSVIVNGGQSNIELF
jgi:hypothetical protein